MAVLALYTDEDVTDLLARALRARGFDVVSAHENDTEGESDADQLGEPLPSSALF
jgi:ActR/RegA family two-component response regulator